MKSFTEPCHRREVAGVRVSVLRPQNTVLERLLTEASWFSVEEFTGTVTRGGCDTNKAKILPG